MKKEDKTRELILVNKDNFHDSLSLFKKKLQSDLLEYISFNCDISNDKKLNQELILSEFSIVHKVNTNNDLDYQIFTFLIPSIKYHKYTKEEYVSFSPILMKYLNNYKDIYDINLITSTNSISYDNLENENMIRENFEKILVDGKRPKSDNTKSYYYYPKALILPSKKYQNKLIENIGYISKQFIEIYNNEIKDQEIKELENENEKKEIQKNLNIYEDNIKLIRELLDFKWILIFYPFKPNMFHIYIDKIKISINSLDKTLDKWIKFMTTISKAFSELKNENIFQINIDDELDDYFYDNFCEFFIKSKITKCEYKKENNEIIFEIVKENSFNSDKMENTLNTLLELKDKNEIEITEYNYYGFDFKKLFEKEIQNNLNINYSFGITIIPSLIPEDLDLNKTEKILDKISYENLFLNINNREDIIFGYQFETLLHKFLKELNNNDNQDITISTEFGKDLEIFCKDNNFLNLINPYFDIKLKNENNFYVVQYKLKNEFNFDELKYNLYEECEKIKIKLLINEELGLSLFYKEIFSNSEYTIIGSNLDKKLNFIFSNIIKSPHKIDESSLIFEKEKIKFFDLQYISRKINYNFLLTYMNFLHDSNFPIKYVTQRFCYIFNEIKQKCNIEEYSNQVFESNEFKNNMILIPTELFNNNYQRIFKILQKHTNFSLSYFNEKDIAITILENEKLKEKEKIENEISEISKKD